MIERSETSKRCANRGYAFVGPAEGRLASGSVRPGPPSRDGLLLGAVTSGTRPQRRSGWPARSSSLPAERRRRCDPVRYLSNHSSGKDGLRRGGGGTRPRSGRDARHHADRACLSIWRAARSGALSGGDARRRRYRVRERRCADHGCGRRRLHAGAESASTRSSGPEGQSCRSSSSRRRTSWQASARTSFESASRRRRRTSSKNARGMLDRIGLDLVVANDVTAPGAGFASETNRVTLIDASGEEELPLMPKYDVAWKLLDRVAAVARETIEPPSRAARRPPPLATPCSRPLRLLDEPEDRHADADHHATHDNERRREASARRNQAAHETARRRRRAPSLSRQARTPMPAAPAALRPR